MVGPDSQKWITRARKYEMLDEYERALICYHKAGLFAPNDRMVLEGKLRCHYRLGNYHDAMRLAKNLYKNTRVPKYSYVIGKIHERRGNDKKAIEYYIKTLKEDPESYDTMIAIAKTLKKQGRHKEAGKYYEKAIKTLKEELSKTANAMKYVLNKTKALGKEVI